jgi:asparagine synthase (glutamine-hydrolysing)
MCGIAGVYGAVDDVALDLTRRMCDSMVHRGPDQDGLWRSHGERGVVLGHRRLSIIDLSDAGRQPMLDPTGAVAIVFNGECYNFLELRAELESLGRRFVSSCDTEVILAAYLQWGERAIERLRGMFAIAIWDSRDGSLLLARDRLGIKPLYYARAGNRFLFASEVRALLSTDLVARKLDRQALGSFLWHGFVPGPRTIVEGVRLLEAGTTLRIDARSAEPTLVPHRYWHYPKRKGKDAAETSLETARGTLEEAVRQHLVSDVPLGIFLSGGVDSSVIAAMAQRSSDRPVTTFNVRFEEARYDESPHARRVAEALGTDHREVTLKEADFSAQLEDALECLDQPTFDALNTYFVSRAVRGAGLTVALAGTGGDELFGGYASFVDLPRSKLPATVGGLLPSRIQRGIGRAAARIASGRPSEVYAQTRWGKLADAFSTRGDLLGLYQVSYGMFTTDFLSELTITPVGELKWGLEPDRAAELAQLVEGQSDLAAISSLEAASFLGERLLRDTDAASMAVSLEVRVPLLDHVVVETVSGVADAQRYGQLRKKLALRHMVEDQLDPGFFDRSKAGFELPLAVWCRRLLADRLDATFRDINLAHAIGLDAEAVGRLWRAFKKHGAGIYWSRVWSLFVLMTWCRRHGVYA